MSNDNAEQSKKDKKIYKAPKLIHYGDISSLTQSGGGSSTDNPGKGGMS